MMGREHMQAAEEAAGDSLGCSRGSVQGPVPSHMRAFWVYCQVLNSVRFQDD